MGKMFKGLKEVDGVIEALKISNETRGKIIDDMIARALDKDKEVEGLRRRVKELKGILNIVDKK